MMKMIQRSLRICIVLTGAWLVSCEAREDKAQAIPAASVNKLAMPDTLETYSPFTGYVMDSARLAASNTLRVYSHVNASCGSCIAEIDQLKELAGEFQKYGVPLILVLSSKDRFEYLKFICESHKLDNYPYPFLLDTHDRWFSINKQIVYSETNPTVLVNEKQEIRLTGNPLHSAKVKTDYLAEIKKNAR
jgi:alkyl hydroperoxide reductase subunit AhpC